MENKPIVEPDKPTSKTEYDLKHHFTRKQVLKPIQELYKKLDGSIKQIDDQIFNKFAKTAITYYSPEKNFVYLKFRKSLMVLNIYINQKTLSGVKKIKDHENWGIIRIKTEKDLQIAIEAIKKSYLIMKSAIRDNINTGWYAVTPKEKMSWVKSSKDAEEEAEEE